MSIPTEVIMRMATLGLNEEQAKAVADMLTAVEAATAATSEAGKEKARARWRKWKESRSTNVDKRLPTTANASKQLADVEDKTSNSENSQKESKGAARGTRLPDDFAPDIEFAICEGMLEVRARTEAASFCDFWRAKPGAGGRKADWQATWRVWVRKSLERAQPRASPSSAKPPSQADVFKLIGEKAANGRQEFEDRGGTRAVVSYLPAVGSR